MEVSGCHSMIMWPQILWMTISIYGIIHMIWHLSIFLTLQSVANKCDLFSATIDKFIFELFLHIYIQPMLCQFVSLYYISQYRKCDSHVIFHLDIEAYNHFFFFKNKILSRRFVILWNMCKNKSSIA